MRVMVFVKATEDSEKGISPTPETKKMFEAIRLESDPVIAVVSTLLTGAVLTAAYAYAPRKNRVALQAFATVAVVVVLVIAIAVRNGQLTGAGG